MGNAGGTRAVAPRGPALSLLRTVVLTSVTSAWPPEQHVDTGQGQAFLGGALPWTSD